LPLRVEPAHVAFVVRSANKQSLSEPFDGEADDSLQQPGQTNTD